MWQRGCFPPKTLIPPRRLHRIRGRYAALSTLVRCAYTQRRTRIGQVLFPFSKYAPGTTRFPVWITVTVAKDNHKEREAVIAKFTDVEDGLLGRRQLGPDQVLRLDVCGCIDVYGGLK